MPVVEALDGEYRRINLSCLTEGLKPETLAKLFLLSGKKEIYDKGNKNKQFRQIDETAYFY